MVEYCDTPGTERREKQGIQSRPTHWRRPLYSTPFRGGGISEVARDEVGLSASTAQLRSGLLALIMRACGNDHACPATDERMGGREAEAPGAARDEGNLSCKRAHDETLFWRCTEHRKYPCVAAPWMKRPFWSDNVI